MRAVLTNLGSTGDVLPLIALAVELRRHGHLPLLALAPSFGPRVQQYGLPYMPIGPDLNYPELHRKEVTAMMHGADQFDLLSNSLAILRSMLPQVYGELRDVCYEADVLISGHLQMASRMVHELTGIPFVSIHIDHFGAKQQLGARQAIASVINPFRAKYGLPPLDDPIHTDANSPQLAIYAMSRYFRERDVGWPEHYHVTGFFFLHEESWEPEPSVAEFIESGSAPVVISFSSMTHEDPDAMTELLLRAIRIAGCRAIINRGWSGLARGEMPPEVYAVDFMPHSWLFKRASCVVHHGGAGTTAAALCAGRPAVIIPHMADQPLWAELTRDLGCAGFVIPIRELTAEELGTAIATTLATPQYYRNVALIGKKVRAEQGVVEARGLIERLVDNIAIRRGAMISPERDVAPLDHERGNRRKEYQRARRLRKRQAPSIPGKNGEV